MSIHELTTENSTVALPTDAARFGVDCEGADHYHSRIHDTVFVVENNQIDRTESLDGRALTEWIAYVDEKRGWGELRYAYDGIADLLVREVA